LTLPGHRRDDRATMPTDADPRPRVPTDGAPTTLDPLDTAFGVTTMVDLLLDDLQPAPASAPAVLAASAPVPLAAMAGRRGGGGRAVLVVDSTPIARKFLALRLQALGYHVHMAESGEQALAMVEDHAYAVVFLELVLAPQDGIDGLRLCQAIKQKPDHPNGVAPAVIVVTGRAGSADRVRSTLAGCDVFLTKPLVKEDLIVAMSDVDPLFG
jgi:two-component system, cell cycle response regulator